MSPWKNKPSASEGFCLPHCSPLLCSRGHFYSQWAYLLLLWWSELHLDSSTTVKLLKTENNKLVAGSTDVLEGGAASEPVDHECSYGVTDSPWYVEVTARKRFWPAVSHIWALTLQCRSGYKWSLNCIWKMMPLNFYFMYFKYITRIM